MTSWRDTTSQDAQDDLDGLLEVVLPLAEQTLAKRDELLPFGAVVNADGRVAMLATEPGLGHRPAPARVLDAVYADAVADADSRRAVAVVADVWTMGGDAVRVELEHRDGVAVVVLLPYQRARFTRKSTFGDLSTSTGQPRFWVDEAR